MIKSQHIMNPISLFVKDGCIADLHKPFDIDGIRKWLATGSHPDSIIASGCGNLAYCTPILIVCQSHKCFDSNAYDVAKLLLDHGANIHQTSQYKGSTERALMLAVYAGQWTGPHAKFIELLLSRGADPNCGTAPEVNLLYSLTLHDKHDCILLFMKYGANKDRICNLTYRRPIIPILESDGKTENYDYLNPHITYQVGVRSAIKQKTINIIKYGYDGYLTIENNFKKNQLEKQASELAEKKARELAEKLTQELAEKKARESAEKQTRELAEKQAQELAEKKTRELAEKHARELAEKKVRELAEKHARELAEKHARELAEKQVRELAEKHARELAEKYARDLAEKQVRELAEKHARELAEKQVRELAEKHARELAEKQARELAEKQVKETSEQKFLEEKQKSELLMKHLNILIERVHQLENMVEYLQNSK